MSNMDPELTEALARIEQQMVGVERDIHEIKVDAREMKKRQQKMAEDLATARGGMRAMQMIGGVVVASGTLVTAFWDRLTG